MSKRIKIIIADDMEPILLYLESILLKTNEFEIVDRVGDGQALVESVIKNHPDVVITDVEMPKLTGIEAIKEINKNPEINTKYIIISGSNISELSLITSKIGVDKIIRKPIIDENGFIETIKNVMNSEKEKIIQENIKEEEIVVKYINDRNDKTNILKRLFKKNK